MIKIKRNCKKIERRKLGIKRSSKARRKLRLWNFAAKRGSLRKSQSARKKFRSPQEQLRKSLFSLRKSISVVKPFRSCLAPAAKSFAVVKTLLGTRVPFHSRVHRFATAYWLRFFPRLESHRFATEAPFRRVFRSCETPLWHTSAISQSRTPISQLWNGLRNRCRISPCCENA